MTERQDPASFRAACVAALVAAGFAVREDVAVADRGDGRRGRVALAAIGHGIEAGIELDCFTPRRKSAVKLASRDWQRFIVLRLRGGIRREFPGITIVYPPEPVLGFPPESAA